MVLGRLDQNSAKAEISFGFGMTSSFKKREKTSDNGEHACCPVCFRDVEIFSIGVCDHPICHECSTRMRVLCKEDACPICRQELTKANNICYIFQVVFVKKVKPYQLLMLNLYPMDKITRIHFENSCLQETFEKLLVHVCYTCPLKPTFTTLQILKDHLRKEHELFFCDLCIDNLKIFSQERRAYTRQELALHRRKGDPDNTSHRGHPLCNFCDQRYVDADELFRHLRRDHYFCHFCDADGLNQYYCNYEDLRKHFRDAHFLCEEGDCKEEKFTRVFRTEIDIRAHKAQTHSQSLGKAAIKQARTLELEFTIAPRSGEQKGRTGRHVRPRVLDKQDSENSQLADQQPPRPVGTLSGANADIGNQEEFPSLSAGSGSVTKSRNNGSDSLAQKLAKSGRFNVKNIVGAQDHDEFPSLVAEGLPPDQQTLQLNDNKTREKASDKKRPVPRGQSAASNEFATDGTSMARISRISTSSNIRVNPGRDLRPENFPSLSFTTPQSSEEPPLKPGWIKKNLPKSKNVSSVHSISNGRKPPPCAEEYPVLVPSSSNVAFESTVWTTSREKAPRSNGTSDASATIRTGSLAELSKVKCKKKQNPTKAVSGKPIEQSLPRVNETKKKAADMLYEDLKEYPDDTPKLARGGRSKLETGNNITVVGNNDGIGSKLNIIKPQPAPASLENNGARPKTKAKSINLSATDFPALHTSAPVTSFFDKAQHDSTRLTHVEEIPAAKTAPTNSSGEHLPLSANSKHGFLQPPDFSARNQQLIATVMDLVCSQRKKIEKFRTISSQFRSGQLDPKEYYMNCLEVVGEDCFLALFPELVCLLPDISKQQQLVKVHRSQSRSRGGVATTEPFVICATCGQVLSPSDLKHHLANHNLELHFPSLGTGPEPDVAWNKR
uniref:RING-type E3 ubiquitin transferase n=1 Tax=Daphnia dolichocephala TaxID=2282166 RepID=A0A4Y7M336_9CRUS|nr:EOG090X01BP [Daphnia dolichocephala]